MCPVFQLNFCLCECTALTVFILQYIIVFEHETGDCCGCRGTACNMQERSFIKEILHVEGMSHFSDSSALSAQIV